MTTLRETLFRETFAPIFGRTKRFGWASQLWQEKISHKILHDWTHSVIATLFLQDQVGWPRQQHTTHRTEFLYSGCCVTLRESLLWFHSGRFTLPCETRYLYPSLALFAASLPFYYREYVFLGHKLASHSLPPVKAQIDDDGTQKTRNGQASGRSDCDRNAPYFLFREPKLAARGDSLWGRSDQNTHTHAPPAVTLPASQNPQELRRRILTGDTTPATTSSAGSASEWVENLCKTEPPSVICSEDILWSCTMVQDERERVSTIESERECSWRASHPTRPEPNLVRGAKKVET